MIKAAGETPGQCNRYLLPEPTRQCELALAAVCDGPQKGAGLVGRFYRCVMLGPLCYCGLRGYSGSFLYGLGFPAGCFNNYRRPIRIFFSTLTP